VEEGDQRKEVREKSDRKEMHNYIFIVFKIGFHLVLSLNPSSLLRLLG
jgi:hypothetical protein